MVKILIVDDDPTMRRLLSTVISKEIECEIKEARNGLEGMREVKTYKPDLVFLDVMMPLFSGEKMLELMKTHEILNHTKVIILTANNTKHIVNKFLEIGVSDFFVKPFNSEDLIARVKKHLGIV